MDEESFTTPNAPSPDNEREPPLVGAPLLTAFLLLIVLPLLVLVVVILRWLID